MQDKSHPKPEDAAEIAEQVLRTPRDLIRWGASRFEQAGLFYGHGTDSALDEAAYLVLHALCLPFDLPDAYLDARLLPAERRRAVAMLEERVTSRRPAAYITGEAWFADMAFEVNEDVLVPRSPIAELIDEKFEPWLGGHVPERILDMGTGCGAIAVACANAFPGARVDAVDISPEALAVARRNIAAYGFEDRVQTIQSDLFQGLSDRRYDLIVANPPYVADTELQTLAREYHHEPEVALLGEDEGLAPALEILHQASDHLTTDGLLVLELGINAGALQARVPELELTWVDLQFGGEGVCVVGADELTAHARREGI
jgi:ribosomal protein L3 glutamine methyltransferase